MKNAIVSDEFAKKEPKLVKDYLAARAAAVEDIKKNPEAAAESWFKATKGLEKQHLLNSIKMTNAGDNWVSYGFDLEALRRVQRLSGAEADLVGQTMAAARQYVMQVTVREIVVDPGGRRATAVCQIAREFHPRVGRVSRQTVTSTLVLERQDNGWIITAVR